MESYKRLFKNLRIYEVPDGLKGKILTRLAIEEKKSQRRKAFIFGSTSVASMGFTVWAFTYLISTLSENGFWSYLALLFAENGALLGYWKEFSFTLLESLPILGLAAFLAGIGVLIWSSVNVLRNSKSIQIKMGIIH